MNGQITVVADDVQQAIQKLGGSRDRAPIEVRPVADGWVLRMSLQHQPSWRVDYGRSGIGYEMEKMCFDLTQVQRWIEIGIQAFQFRVDAFQGGWRPDQGSTKSPDEQITDWYSKNPHPLTDGEIGRVMRFNMARDPDQDIQPSRDPYQVPPGNPHPPAGEGRGPETKAMAEGRLTAGTEKGQAILERLYPGRPTIVGGMGASHMTRDVIHEVLGQEVPFDSGAER